MKVMLDSCHLIGHHIALGFHPGTLEIEQPCTSQYTEPHESTAQ